LTLKNKRNGTLCISPIISGMEKKLGGVVIRELCDTCKYSRPSGIIFRECLDCIPRLTTTNYAPMPKDTEITIDWNMWWFLGINAALAFVGGVLLIIIFR
jgi:hypothetical protein